MGFFDALCGAAGSGAAKESSEQTLNTFQKYLPDIAKMVRAEYAPDALSQLQAAQWVSKGYSDLAKWENQANVEGATETLRGLGSPLATELTKIQNQLDPEYSQARAGVTKGLLDVDKTYDLNGLSDSEAAAAERALSKGTIASGNLGSGGALELAKNMRGFGDAFDKKRLAKTQNLGLLGQVLPSLKSGMSAAGMIPSLSEIGRGYGAYQGAGSGGQSNAQGLLGNIFSTGNAAIGQPTTAMNAMNSTGKFIGSIAGGIACWVAREVYGEDDIRWKLFRAWLYQDAPAWFRNLYIKHGEKFAAFIRNKPVLKVLIRVWMNSRIEKKFAYGY